MKQIGGPFFGRQPFSISRKAVVSDEARSSLLSASFSIGV
jgi:hypothetical protein